MTVMSSAMTETARLAALMMMFEFVAFTIITRSGAPEK
jgi:hypothetical protein